MECKETPCECKAEIKRLDTEWWLLARVLDRAVQRAKAAEARVAELEGKLASCTDLANSWARETGITEAENEDGLKNLIDRLWAAWSSRYFAQQENYEQALSEGRAASCRGKGLSNHMTICYRAWVTRWRPSIGNVEEFCKIIHRVADAPDGTVITTDLECEAVDPQPERPEWL